MATTTLIRRSATAALLLIAVSFTASARAALATPSRADRSLPAMLAGLGLVGG